MSCDLTSGRLLDDCLLGRSGIKTLYFTKFNDFDSLTGVVESGGEITSLGTDPISIYQFDMQDNVGSFEEIPNSTPENGTVFLTQNVTLTLFYIKPDDLADLNNLKRGRWVIWALDFQGKIRLFGRTRGMVASGGSDTSGTAPGDKKGLDLILSANEQDYAPFMQDYTTTPFDNFANVTVVSAGGYDPGLLTDFVNGASFPFTTFSWASDILACAKPSQPAYEGCSSNDLGNVVNGDSFTIDFTITLNSGSMPQLMMADSQAGYAGSESNVIIPTSGVNSVVLTRTSGNTECYLQVRPLNTGLTNFSMSVISIVKN